MMETSLTYEQMKQFMEIVQMVALLDEAVEKYIAEFYSLCNDKKAIRRMTKKIKGLESACAEIQRILKKNSALNKPMIEGMTEKYHQIKEIRNYIAHDRQLLVITGLNNKFPDNAIDESLDEEVSDMRNVPIEKLYEKASVIFDDFRDFLGQLYYEPNEEEYQVERRINLYGK